MVIHTTTRTVSSVVVTCFPEISYFLLGICLTFKLYVDDQYKGLKQYTRASVLLCSILFVSASIVGSAGKLLIKPSDTADGLFKRLIIAAVVSVLCESSRSLLFINSVSQHQFFCLSLLMVTSVVFGFVPRNLSVLWLVLSAVVYVVFSGHNIQLADLHSLLTMLSSCAASMHHSLNLPFKMRRIVLGVCCMTVMIHGFAVGDIWAATPSILISFASMMVLPEQDEIIASVACSVALFQLWECYVKVKEQVAHEAAPAFLVTLASVAFFIAVKNSIRRLFMRLPVKALLSTGSDCADIQDKLMFLLEHTMFSAWAYCQIVLLPEQAALSGTGSGSWLLHPELCWTLPAMPSAAFRLFFVAKTGTHVEDLLYIAVLFLTQQREVVIQAPSAVVSQHARFVKPSPEGRPVGRDLMMDVHHIITALLCISSFLSGYVKIGSLVMLLHDISDVPLDLLRICIALQWKTAQIPVFIVVLLNWFYWRLWILPTVVLKTIMFDSRSFLFPCSKNCFWILNTERAVFAVALGVLLTLHVMWFYKMLKKGHREIFGTSKKSIT